MLSEYAEEIALTLHTFQLAQLRMGLYEPVVGDVIFEGAMRTGPPHLYRRGKHKRIISCTLVIIDYITMCPQLASSHLEFHCHWIWWELCGHCHPQREVLDNDYKDCYINKRNLNI